MEGLLIILGPVADFLPQTTKVHMCTLWFPDGLNVGVSQNYNGVSW